MKPEDLRKLSLGLYRIYWHDEPGDCSLASVGQNAQGERWFAPTNWITVPSYNWSMVERVEPILPVNGETVIAAEEPAEPLNPMIPCLTGWLAGILGGRGKQDFAIASVRLLRHDTLEITFASGLVVQVDVKGQPSW